MPAALKYATGLWAKALLAGRGIYFATRLVWLPYLGKFRSITCGAFDFCAKG
jgi:hypothetical protein